MQPLASTFANCSAKVTGDGQLVVVRLYTPLPEIWRAMRQAYSSIMRHFQYLSQWRRRLAIRSFVYIQTLVIQCLLPPITPIIRRRIFLRRSGNIQVQNRRLISILWKLGYSRPIRISLLCKVRDIFLKCYCRFCVEDHWIRPIVIRVGNISPMDCGWDREVIGICIIVVSLVQVKRVAREDHFGDLGSGSSYLACVLLGLTAIKDCWIECVHNVVQSSRICLNCWR